MSGLRVRRCGIEMTRVSLYHLKFVSGSFDSGFAGRAGIAPTDERQWQHSQYHYAVACGSIVGEQSRCRGNVVSTTTR